MSIDETVDGAAVDGAAIERVKPNVDEEPMMTRKSRTRSIPLDEQRGAEFDGQTLGKKPEMKNRNVVEKNTASAKTVTWFDQTDLSRGMEPVAISVDVPVDGTCSMVPFFHISTNIMSAQEVDGSI